MTNLLVSETTGERYENSIICWVEVEDGMRVKAQLPAEEVDKLNLYDGDKFLWDCENHKAFPKPIDPEEEAEYQRIKEDFLALEKDWHENLKHIDTGLDDE